MNITCRGTEAIFFFKVQKLPALSHGKIAFFVLFNDQRSKVEKKKEITKMARGSLHGIHTGFTSSVQHFS